MSVKPTCGTRVKGDAGTPACSSLVHTQNQSSIAPDATIRHERFGPSDYDSFPPATSKEQNFRHSGWSADRHRVFAALKRTGTPNRVLDAFANCGSSLWLEASGDDLALTSNHCHCRHCRPCATVKFARLVENIHHHTLGRERSVRFVTFTLRASPTSLAAKVTRLWSCFRTLRQRALWKSAVVGGAAFVEIKLGSRSGAWHVHLHCLVETPWIDQAALSRAWHEVTGDSYVVDVRPIDSAAGSAAYVAKYATKPCNSDVIRNPEKIDEVIVSTRGRRLWQCFGSWRGMAPGGDVPAAGPRRRVGALDQLAAAAAAGDEQAARWFAAACRKWPALAQCFSHPTPTDFDASPP